MNRQVVLVNSRDQAIGKIDLLTAHQNPAQLHRAISIVIFNSQNQLLLQKRSRQKPLFPLFWSNTCCTHPQPGETSLQAANRRLFEEMGLKTKLKFLYKFTYQAPYNSKLSEHELDSVFLGCSDDQPQPNPQEAADFKYLTLDQINQDIKNHPKKYTPWFKLILKRLSSSDILTS